MSIVQIPLQLTIERLIETLLKFDPETRERLASINGKTLALRLRSPTISVNLSIVDGRVFCLNQGEGGIDTTITGSLADVLSLQQSNDVLYTHDVVIDGDLGVGQRLKDIIRQLDPNWQDALTPIVGGSLVHYLDVKQSAFTDWFSRSRRVLLDSTKDYIQEESEIVISNRRISNFCDDVDDVKDSVERLEARINQLENRLLNRAGEDT